MARLVSTEVSASPPADPAITSREAARLLGVSITTAQIWMESGLLTSWKTPGGHRRTRLSSVLNLLGSQQEKCPEYSKHVRQQLAVGYPVGENEAERANFVEQTMEEEELKSESRFHRLTWLASELLDVPIALVTFLTSDLQIFRAAHGLDISSTPRSWAFCNYAVLQEDIFIVPDATIDPRFVDNPMVTSSPFIRFYAGVCLAYQGRAFGSLCIIDTEPRILRAHERQALQALAGLASDILSLNILESKLG